MGETAVETRREIDQLRSEMTQLIEELEQRARLAADVRAQVAANPVVVGLLGAALTSALGGTVFIALRSRQRKQEEEARIDHRAAELLGLLRKHVKPPVSVEIVTDDRDPRRRRERHRAPPARDPGAIKKVLWAALTAGLMALATMLARRLTETVWERAMHEVPPEKVVA
jgi:hypothetical protein